MDIWISSRLYRLLPLLCLLVATVATGLPEHVVKWWCIAYLYGYGLVISYKRFF